MRRVRFEVAYLAVALLAAALLGGCAGPEELARSDQVARDNKSAAEKGVRDQPVAGTAPTPVADPKGVWRERRKQLLALDHWTAFGKLALRSDSDAWSASLYWKQDGEDYRIRLSGPLGSGTVQIRGGPGGVELRTADNKTYQAASPEELLYKHAGWWVPLTGLRYWILGRIEPRTPVARIFIDVAGRVVGFDQGGWRVKYLDYTDVDAFAMPRKAGLQNERVTASLLLTRWNTGGALGSAGAVLP